MADFKKALSKERYAFVKEKLPEMYGEIVAFSSTFQRADFELAEAARVEDYCMGLARRAYQAGLNWTRG